jgi:hypothetical protein
MALAAHRRIFASKHSVRSTMLGVARLRSAARWQICKESRAAIP